MKSDEEIKHCKVHKEVSLKNRKDKKGKFCPACAGHETRER